VFAQGNLLRCVGAVRGRKRGGKKKDTTMNRKYNVAPTFRLYSVLGVTNHSTEEEIKKAYRKLVLQYHPDKLGNAKDDEETKSKIHDINLAYSVLSDSEKRAQYFTYGDYSLSETEMDDMSKSGSGLSIREKLEGVYKKLGKAFIGFVVLWWIIKKIW